MRLPRWEEGRQGSGYRRLTLLSAAIRLGELRGLDLHLIDYPPGSTLPAHLDPVPGARHFRLNLVLLTGRSSFAGDVLFQLGERLVLFRPDRMVHGVARCATRRLVLSLGWALAE